MSSVLRTSIRSLTKKEYVDDFDDAIFSRISYPTEAISSFVTKVDGSDPMTISGVGDTPTSTGGGSIDLNIFADQPTNFSNITYPSA